jgi:hypothetical protein
MQPHVHRALAEELEDEKMESRELAIINQKLRASLEEQYARNEDLANLLHEVSLECVFFPYAGVFVRKRERDR